MSEINHTKRNAMVRPAQTQRSVCALASRSKNTPAANDPPKLPIARSARAIAPRIWIAAEKPLPRDHWLRVRRQRSHRTVFSCSQCISDLQPAQFLRGKVLVSDQRNEFVLQRSRGAQPGHSALIHQPALGNNADIRARSEERRVG